MKYYGTEIPYYLSKADRVEKMVKVRREKLGVARLPSGEREAIEVAVAKGDKRRAGQPRVSEAKPIEALRERVRKAAQVEVEPIVRASYRTASSSWAGGETDIRVSLSKEPYATGLSIRRWSSNGKWSGNNANLTVNVMLGWRKFMAAHPGLSKAGGMLTTHAEAVEPGLYKAAWVVQGRGFSLSVESGYIAQFGTAWYHGKTAESARRGAKKQALHRLVSEQSAGFKATLRDMSAADIAAQFGGITVVRSDSIKAGNCASGTDSWINRYFPERTSATVAEVLKADSGSYAIQAVRAAILRDWVKSNVKAA